MLRSLLVACLLAGCGGGGETTATGATSSTTTDQAGKVRELSGKVIATRGTTTRTLAAGDPVAAEDLIDTGADGSVVIELAHNNALWSLEAGIKARVDQSVAWGLPKQEAAKPIGHATSSAGRHAAREAANTAVSADEAAEDPDPAAATAEASTSPPPPPPPPPPKPRVTTKSGKQTGAGTGDRERDKGSGTCDEVACLLEPSSACCAKYKQPGRVGQGKPPAPPDSASLPPAPSRVDIQNAMKQIKPAILECTRADTKGILKLTIKVGGDGKVTSVVVQQSPDAAIDRCVVDAVKQQPFARSQNGVTFTYPFVF